jgi:hypothetical protein
VIAAAVVVAAAVAVAAAAVPQLGPQVLHQAARLLPRPLRAMAQALPRRRQRMGGARHSLADMRRQPRPSSRMRSFWSFVTMGMMISLPSPLNLTPSSLVTPCHPLLLPRLPRILRPLRPPHLLARRTSLTSNAANGTSICSVGNGNGSSPLPTKPTSMKRPALPRLNLMSPCWHSPSFGLPLRPASPPFLLPPTHVLHIQMTRVRHYLPYLALWREMELPRSPQSEMEKPPFMILLRSSFVQIVQLTMFRSLVGTPSVQRHIICPSYRRIRPLSPSRLALTL